jgi:thymidylate synthase (FAD)
MGDNFVGKLFQKFIKNNWACVKIECPIFIRAQIIRHRSFSFLEMSRRYVNNKKKPFEFYALPSEDEEKAIARYLQAIEEGEPPEFARRFIPQSAMTTFYMAGNKRAWDNFFNLRCDPHAQQEVRIVANAIKNLIRTHQGWKL